MRLEGQIESVVRAHSLTAVPRSMPRGWIPRSNHTVRLDPGHWSKRHRRASYWQLIDLAHADVSR